MNLRKENTELNISNNETAAVSSEHSQAQAAATTGILQEFRSLIERSLELELVLSGAVTFSLLQLPGVLESLQTSVIAQYGASGLMLFVAIFLAKPVTYLLVGSLLLHLVCRSFWIGMIGVSAVYPDSSKPTKSGGFFYRQMMQTSKRGLKEQAASVDKFCRLIFGFAFSTIAIFLGAFVLISVSFLLSIIVQRFLFPQYRIATVTLAIYFFLFLPYFLAGLLDTLIMYVKPMKRLQENQAVKRFIVSTTTIYLSVFGSAGMSVQSTISANAPRVYYAIFGAGMVVFFAYLSITVGYIWRTHPYYPEDGMASEIGRNYYENSADADDFARVMIQSDMLKDPYLKLFLGYNTRYDDSLQKYMPSVKPFYTQGLDKIARDGEAIPPERLQATIDVLRSAYIVTLNGKNLDSVNFGAVNFRFYTHPKNKQKGILTYICADSLLRGENMLIVRDRFDTTVVRYIPFWR